MAAGMPMTAFAKPDWPSDTGIESEAGIVMDADSGAVLFGQNIHVQKAPAKYHENIDGARSHREQQCG